jgi:hypothetical protein
MDQTEGAVGWGTLTLINAGLAQGKGRSGLGWFLASVLLGPVATFFIVVLPAIEPKIEPTPREGWALPPSRTDVP